VKALVYGASGELAGHIAAAFAGRGWTVDQVTRCGSQGALADAPGERHQVEAAYGEFQPTALHDAYVFPQALFARKALAEMSSDEIQAIFDVGLTDIARCLARVLALPAAPDRRIDYCVIGSTSAYAGFANTAAYCAVKHGLVGLVRALNDEYAATGRRFWLFSMGTMDTAMGRLLVDQDETTFLPPAEVAGRIVEAVCSPANLFEPEVVIRRRIVRFKDR
jgi:3-hydroxybutyrate dehydrogenase